ncbi:MAG: hypothetical protein HY332_23685 [Chloroflexi bacterium]|nr:hypothetical protein [Chloroflexota bacterium]
MPSEMYLVAAYLVVGGGLAVYALSLRRRRAAIAPALAAQDEAPSAPPLTSTVR